MTKNFKLLSALCCLVYFASYVTRINYGAVISEIVAAEGFLKSSAGIVATSTFISYGTGQIISGYMGDRLSPKKLIFWGLVATSLFNILMPFCKSVHAMTVIWFLNGFAQAFMWPPLVKVMACNLNEEQFKKTCVSVTMSSSLGTIFVYLVSPLCIKLYGWRLVFFLSAFIGTMAAVSWLFGQRKIESSINVTDKKTASEKGEPTGKIIAASGLVFIAISIILQGLVRDGITTWMPLFYIRNISLGQRGGNFNNGDTPRIHHGKHKTLRNGTAKVF